MYGLQVWDMLAKGTFLLCQTTWSLAKLREFKIENRHVRDLIPKASWRMPSAILSWFETHCSLHKLRNTLLWLCRIQAAHRHSSTELPWALLHSRMGLEPSANRRMLQLQNLSAWKQQQLPDPVRKLVCVAVVTPLLLVKHLENLCISPGTLAEEVVFDNCQATIWTWITASGVQWCQCNSPYKINIKSKFIPDKLYAGETWTSNRISIPDF